MNTFDRHKNRKTLSYTKEHSLVNPSKLCDFVAGSLKVRWILILAVIGTFAFVTTSFTSQQDTKWVAPASADSLVNPFNDNPDSIWVRMYTHIIGAEHDTDRLSVG